MTTTNSRWKGWEVIIIIGVLAVAGAITWYGLTYDCPGTSGIFTFCFK